MRENRTILWGLSVLLLAAGCAAPLASMDPLPGVVGPTSRPLPPESLPPVYAAPVQIEAGGTVVDGALLPLVAVDRATFCESVKDRVPEGPAKSFEASLGKIYFFTRVLGAEDETVVLHVWYWGDREMARVVLDVRSASWRTWSSKRIMPDWKGTWTVKVLDANGTEVLSQSVQVL